MDTARRVLVPTDLSDASFKALKHATERAGLYDAKVLLLHVIDENPHVALPPAGRLSMGSPIRSERRPRRGLRQFLKEGRLRNVPIQTQLVFFGGPADRVVHAASEQTVDLLVLASHSTQTRPEQPWVGWPAACSVASRVRCCRRNDGRLPRT